MCFQDLMFLSRGDRDLGVAFQTHLVSQALSRGEAKDSILLSSRDAGLLEPPERPQPQLEETPETPPSSRAEGLLFLHGLDTQLDEGPETP